MEHKSLEIQTEKHYAHINISPPSWISLQKLLRKKEKKQGRICFEKRAGELMNPELVYSLGKAFPDSEGSFTDWHLSSRLQVVLCALLTRSTHNCLTGWCGKEGTIKQDEYESPLPHSWLAGPKLDLMNDYCLLFFPPSLQSAGRRINALSPGCQRDE